MAYKCTNCGHIFEEGEAATWNEPHGFTDGFCETFYGCPICKGDYEETTPCAECGREKTKSELYGGFCEKCLHERMSNEVAINYLLERRILIDFAFAVLFGVDAPKATSKSLVNFILPFVEKHATKEKLVTYIFDDEAGIEDFAEWLSMADRIEKGVK